jgi:hypothetical protein
LFFPNRIERFGVNQDKPIIYSQRLGTSLKHPISMKLNMFFLVDLASDEMEFARLNTN